MRKKLVWLLVGSMLVSSAFLGGCGKKVTAQSLIEDVNKKMESIKSYEAAMDMDMSLGMESEGIEMNIDIGIDGDMEVVMDPMITHMDVNMVMSLLGLDMDMDMYVQVDGDQAVTYMGLAGEWMKTTQPFTDDMAMNEVSFNVGDPSKLTLAEKTEMLDGGEAYVITGTISGEELQAVLASAESLMESMADIDLSGLQADMTIKIYKDSGYPASMEVVMSGDGITTEEDGIVMSITNLSMIMEYKGFDTMDTIEIPPEVLAAPEMEAELEM